jgi:hypothetical protein
MMPVIYIGPESSFEAVFGSGRIADYKFMVKKCDAGHSLYCIDPLRPAHMYEGTGGTGWYFDDRGFVPDGSLARVLWSKEFAKNV